MPYLPEAVDSILNQTMPDFRLLILDDGSTDDTAQYLQSLRDPRADVVRHENRGLGATLNRGIEMCKTKYIARMDADDVSAPERLELQLSYIERNPDAVAVGSQVKFFAGTREFPGPWEPLDHDRIAKGMMAGHYTICHGASMFQTEGLSRIGGYRVIRGYAEDVDLFLRLFEVGRAANLKEVLYAIRLHRGSLNFTSQEKVSFGRRFSIECARCRQRGLAEPTEEQFMRNWRSTWLQQLGGWLDDRSAVEYRRALVELGESRMVTGYLRLGRAALLRPGAVVRRLLGRLRS
jgi:glycosyltransferase involved in cell wall biosynthesis